MAVVYSQEVVVDSYNRIRLKLDYSGTSATCYIQFRRAASYGDYGWADSASSIVFNGREASAPYGNLGYVDGSWRDITSASGYTVSTSGGTYSWEFKKTGGGVLSGSGTIDVPTQLAPSDLTVSDITYTTNTMSATVSVSAWNGGDATTRRRSLSLCTGQNTSQRKWNREISSTKSSTLAVDNAGTGDSGTEGAAFTITPNTQYYVTAAANNGTNGTGNTVYTPIVMLAEAATLSVGTVSGTSAIISYSTSADGGYYDKTIEYSLDSGTTWQSGPTITGGSAATGTFTISGLVPNVANSVQTRMTTTSGSTTGATLTITPAVAATLYGSISGQTKEIKKLYCSVNSQTRRVKKLYASVGGLTKLVFEG